MLKPDTRISLADLTAVGIPLRPMDAVAIVRELVLQVSRGVIPGVPSPHVIRIAPSGKLLVEGPVAAGSRSISRAAQLLETLLPPFDAAVEMRVPGALRLALARAMGTIDLPPYPSLEAFAETLSRFSHTDIARAMRDLASRWARAADLQGDEVDGDGSWPAPEEPAPVTISDIRRARRATGLPLSEIAERSRIPADLLRQLEWGYLRHWPVGLYGRTQLVRYARASGLDEQLVIATVWPMIEAASEFTSAAALPESATEPKSEVATAAAQPMATVSEAAGEPVAASAGDRSAPVAGEPVAAVVEKPALVATGPRLGLDDFPAEQETERDVPQQPSHEPELVNELEVAAAGHALLWEPEIASTPELFHTPAPQRRRGARIAGWLAAAAALALASTSLVQDRLLRDRDQKFNAIRTTVDRISAAIPPIRRPELPLWPAPTVAVPEQASEQPGASEAAAPPPPQPAVARVPIEDAVAQSPSFATVGSAAFYSGSAATDGALVPADDRGDGSVLRITRVVDDHAKNYHARPSPNGEHIAFDSDRDGERGVYVANVDGSNVRRVSGPGYAAIPSWSPDGTRLAFVRAEQDEAKVWNLWTVDLATGDLHRLTSHRTGQPWGGSWFPDGDRVAYSLDDRLIIHDVGSGREKAYPSPRKGQMVRTPAVSPDGLRVIFQVYRDGAWLLDLSDGSMRKVLADPTAEEYSWSPDGRRVAYHSRRSGQWGVWLMVSR